MKILFQYFTGGGGALSNITLLLQAMSRQFPQDHFDIVCSKSSDLHSLGTLPNVEVLSYGGNRHQEITRAFLGFGGLRRIARERHADIVWSLNIGSYIRTSIPQVLSVNNPHQVYPWYVTRYHPDSSLNVYALRWFFRKSLRVADGVIVQTPIMGECIRKISGAPRKIEVVAKAVENTDDVLPEQLPMNMQKKLEDKQGKHAFTFLYVATYTPHKNHKTLIETFDILACEGVMARVIFTIGHDELIACGGEKTQRLIESGYLVPVGWTGKAHLRSLYDACDACLMPSVLESLSSAHLEAMQWGKPQINADLPYAHDLCGNAAIYVSAEDPKAWAVKIQEFILDTELRTKLIEAGHEQMRQFPATWAEVAHKVHAFLEKIVADKKTNNWARK